MILKNYPPPKTCEWPFGEVGTDDFHFCGKKTAPGKPYCARHCRRAYRGFSQFRGPRFGLRKLTAFEAVK